MLELIACLGGRLAVRYANPSTNRIFLNFSFRVRLEDAQHILYCFRVLVRAVIGRDDVLSLRTIHMRAPIRHDSIAGIW